MVLRLAAIFDCPFNIFAEVEKMIESEEKQHGDPESKWGVILGTHVLKKLAVNSDMTVDVSFPGINSRCLCGCKAPVRIGDCSFGKIHSIKDSFSLKKRS